jgi:ketosteroid isomerase-like protein
MAIEELERVLRAFTEALNRGDREGWVAAFHPEFEGYSGLVTMEGGAAFRGLEGAGAWFDNLMEVYETVQATVEQSVTVDEHSLSLVRVSYVGKGSGIALEAVLAWVMELRDGLFVYARSHFDLAEGFKEMADRMTGVQRD